VEASRPKGRARHLRGSPSSPQKWNAEQSARPLRPGLALRNQPPLPDPIRLPAPARTSIYAAIREPQLHRREQMPPLGGHVGSWVVQRSPLSTRAGHRPVRHSRAGGNLISPGNQAPLGCRPPRSAASLDLPDCCGARPGTSTCLSSRVLSKDALITKDPWPLVRHLRERGCAQDALRPGKQGRFVGLREAGLDSVRQLAKLQAQQPLQHAGFPLLPAPLHSLFTKLLGESAHGLRLLGIGIPRRQLLTLVPQLRCGTPSPEALLPRALPRATAGAVEAELRRGSTQAEAWVPGTRLKGVCLVDSRGLAYSRKL
jgi:hypothetical protein